MADHASFSDDISALWGVPEEGALEPRRSAATESENDPPDPAPTNADPAPTNGSGTGVAADDPRDPVARLADAIAGHHVDVVRRSELEAVRSELEEAFTHQLAVALYELLAASNERFAAVEDHLDQRLQDVAQRLSTSVGEHAGVLAASIEAHQRTTTELAEAARVELATIRDRFSGPVDAFATFQRDMRHEVGRIVDMVESHAADFDRSSTADAERFAEAHAEFSERLGHNEGRASDVVGEVGNLSARLAAVQNDVAGLHEAIDELRRAVDAPRKKPRGFSRWNRSDGG